MNVKKIGIVVAAIVVLGAVGSAMSGGSDTDKKDDPKQQEEKKEFYAVNETAELKNQKFTVTKVEKSSGSDFDKPKEGKEYVIVTVSVENTSDDTISYNPFYFKMQNSQGQIESQAFTIVDSDTSLKSGDLAAGGKIEGTIAFEQPVDDADLTLIYTSATIGGEEVKVKLQ